MNREGTAQLAQDSGNISALAWTSDLASPFLFAVKAAVPKSAAPVLLVVLAVVGWDASYVHDDAQSAYDNGNCAALNSYRLGFDRVLRG